MRIAISGTHISGKSTLVEDLAERLPTFETVEEPYYLLEEEGYQFPEMPTAEDFEQQLRRSIKLLEEQDGDVIFDRCPLDFIAYLLSLPNAHSFDLNRWLPRVRSAMARLDLIVYLPAENVDRIPAPKSQQDEFRLAVDERLRELFVDNPLEIDMEVVEITGSREQRVGRVMNRIPNEGIPLP